MRITHAHHIAIATADPSGLAAFYCDVLRMNELRHFTDDRGLRSVWLGVGADPRATILMLERSDEGPDVAGDTHGRHNYHWKRPGLHLLALAIDAREKDAWASHLQSAGITIEERSPFTLYFRDPEGNRIALSWYTEQPTTSPQAGC